MLETCFPQLGYARDQNQIAGSTLETTDDVLLSLTVSSLAVQSSFVQAISGCNNARLEPSDSGAYMYHSMLSCDARAEQGLFLEEMFPHSSESNALRDCQRVSITMEHAVVVSLALYPENNQQFSAVNYRASI